MQSVPTAMIVKPRMHAFAQREAEAERRRARRYAEREQRRIEHEEHQRLESADRARRRQEREDREALEAAAARQQEERERLERARNVGLTRRPRPGAVVHQRAREGIAERGARVIREAIRAGNERRDQDNQPPRPGAGWERRRDVGEDFVAEILWLWVKEGCTRMIAEGVERVGSEVLGYCAAWVRSFGALEWRWG